MAFLGLSLNNYGRVNYSSSHLLGNCLLCIIKLLFELFVFGEDICSLLQTRSFYSRGCYGVLETNHLRPPSYGKLNYNQW